MPDLHYLGHSCFRLRGRDGIVLCDPFDRSIGLDIGRPTAHIVTLSHDHPGHNNSAAVRGVGEQPQPFLINGPGEYEVRGVLINGIRTYHDKEKGQVRGYNTVYVIRLDDVIFCHLGDLNHELTAAQLDEIGNVDVLFVPVGGDTTIAPAEAASVIGQIEPRMIIPMHYASPQLAATHQLASLDKFVHEMGIKDTTPQEKISVTPSTLPAEGEDTRIVIMLSGSN